MRDDHRHGMRDGDWGPQRPGRPEWGPGSGRGPGRRGGERGERGDRGERGERGYGRHGGRGGPFGPGFGPMGPGGPGAGLAAMFDRQAMFDRHAFGRGPRARKGDVRAAILDLLDEGGQWNGYQLIQEIAGRTSGVWRPSAGSVYPALQQLEDEGLIAPEGEGRRRMYALTDAGRAYAEEHADELSGSWDAVAGMTDDEAIELGDLVRQVMIAVMEVRRAGSPEQLTQARAVLAQTRRSMYRILAEDDPTGTAADAATATDATAAADATTATGTTTATTVTDTPAAGDAPEGRA
jgi:DNA-binding PadR family transcriptional regulator